MKHLICNKEMSKQKSTLNLEFDGKETYFCDVMWYKEKVFVIRVR